MAPCWLARREPVALHPARRRQGQGGRPHLAAVRAGREGPNSVPAGGQLVLRSLTSVLLAVSVLGAGCGGASSDPKDVGTTDVIHIPGKPAKTASMEISKPVAPAAVGLQRCKAPGAVDSWGRNVA